MSYSLEEPEWRPVCQCRYDEVRDKMDRGDCEIHCGMEEEVSQPEEFPLPEPQTTPRKPVVIARREENAA